MPEGGFLERIPRAWVAKGPGPVGVLRPQTDNGLYLAAKGGGASDNHAHMDAGSFILEWRKIRWSVDPGKLDYTALEAAIGAKGLWDKTQDSPRWDYLAHNNFGHSTLSVNGEMHRVEGRALLVDQDLESERPSFTLDLTPLYGDGLASARRTFQRISEDRLRITDDIVSTDSTQSVAWQFITRADVEVLEHGALVRQEGEQLELRVLSPEDPEIRVTPLDPTALPGETDLSGLKRIEVIVTLWASANSITVEISGNDDQ